MILRHFYQNGVIEYNQSDSYIEKVLNYLMIQINIMIYYQDQNKYIKLPENDIKISQVTFDKQMYLKSSVNPIGFNSLCIHI